MKRKTIAALLAPVLFLILLAGCTTHGVASCNGDLGRCYVQESQQPTGVGVFIKGPGCKKICRKAATCNGFVAATVNHDAPTSTEPVVETAEEDVGAVCREP